MSKLRCMNCRADVAEEYQFCPVCGRPTKVVDFQGAPALPSEPRTFINTCCRWCMPLFVMGILLLVAGSALQWILPAKRGAPLDWTECPQCLGKKSVGTDLQMKCHVCDGQGMVPKTYAQMQSPGAYVLSGGGFLFTLGLLAMFIARSHHVVHTRL